MLMLFLIFGHVIIPISILTYYYAKRRQYIIRKEVFLASTILVFFLHIYKTKYFLILRPKKVPHHNKTKGKQPLSMFN